MPIEKLRPSFTFTEDRLAELRAVVPEAFADGAVNWEALREALGAYLEDEGPDAEHFGLTWPGKRQARRLAARPSKGTLIPAPGEGVDEATTRNLFIEGDNLEVLKLLQKSYAGRVKMIYIDPPYNTGNDFVYKDNYTEPLGDYLKKTQQVDENGELLISNPRAAGRFHSNWLNMIYPRIRLSKNLLRPDGVIFVSIDDNEMHHLRQVMNEVFGEENFVALLVVQLNPRGRTLDRYIAKTHEYILVFTNDPDVESLHQIAKIGKALEAYNKSDSEGRYRELELRNRNPVFTRANRPNLYYPFYVDPSSGRVSLERSDEFSVEVYPRNSKGDDGCWTWSKDKARKNNELLLARQVNTGSWRVFRKDYIPEDGATTKAKSIWLDSSINNEHGKEELGRLFGKPPFDFPKAVDLVRKCLEIGTAGDDEEIILDFFAGSCTTAQAVFEMNRSDGGSRRFIMVQVPELTPESSNARELGYITISDVGKERIRRVIKRMKQETQSKRDLQERDTPEDLGFRVYKLGRSNYKVWQDYQGESVEELETFFDRIETPLVDGWQREHVLVEVMLLQGFPLDSTVTDEQGFERNRIQRIESDAVGHRLFVCLDDRIVDETIAQIQLAAEDVFICLDSALTDEAKLRLGDRCNLRVI